MGSEKPTGHKPLSRAVWGHGWMGCEAASMSNLHMRQEGGGLGLGEGVGL